MNFRSRIRHVLLAFVLFPTFLWAQQQRPDRIGLGVGTNLALIPTSAESGNIDFNTGSSISFSGNYYKTLHPHLDVKGAIGWHGIAGSTFGEGAFTSGNIRNIEVLPLYFSNPDKLGFVPAKFQFYAGAGVGVATVSLSGRSQLDLNENEQALLEFGLLEAQEELRQGYSTLFFPVTFGVIQRTKGVWHIGYEATFNLSLNQQVEHAGIFLPGWAQISVIVGRKR